MILYSKLEQVNKIINIYRSWKIMLGGNSMVTNFDYLKAEPKFSRFADVAISAEKIILMDPEASIINSRRAMEFAIKWMYSVDSELEMPYQDNLQSLMNAEEYRQIVGPDLWKRMDYIRRCGNSVAHSNRKLGRDEAMLCLENLFIYLDYIAYCYSDKYEEHAFNKAIIDSRVEKAKESREAANATREKLAKEQEKAAQQELDLQKLIAENASLKEELSARRQEQQQTYVPKPLDLSEYKTRKLYIDAMLMDAGWKEGIDWINEVELPGMPNKSEIGRADYIETLEEILWREVGTKQDYENEFGTKPLGEFVREIVGLDMNAAKEAFSEYLTNTSLDSRQIYFVNQIVEYIVHNGMLKDFSVLQESPFTDQGSVVEIFTDISVWLGIKKVIDTINANAVA